MVTFGIAVLVLGGMGTTLAGTITLNGTNNSVEFGQGVVTTAACDSSISIIPVSDYDTKTAGTYQGFYVSELKVAGIGSSLNDTSTAAGLASGCLGKTFTLTGYDSSGNVVPFNGGADGQGSAFQYWRFKLPLITETASAFNNPPTGLTSEYGDADYTMGGNFKAFTGTEVNTNLTNTGLVTISGFRALATLARVTLETS